MILETLLTTVAPALLPVLMDGVRAGFVRLTGGAGREPANHKERLELVAADTARLQALAALDAPGGPVAPWVANLRASSRYLAALGVVGVAALVTLSGPALELPAEAVASAQEWGQAGMFFLLGDRAYTHIRRS
jgi:hypothetical protein